MGVSDAKQWREFQQSDTPHYAYGCSFTVDTYFIIQNYKPFEF